MVDGEQRRSLKVDPAAPALARLSQNRPTDSRLRADAVDMGANGRRPVREGAAQAELHARSDVGGAPVGRTVLDRRRERARKIPDGVSFPPPDMPLVEMGVHVDEERQHDAPRHCDFWRFAEVVDTSGKDFRDCALVNEDVDDGEPIIVERPDRLRQHAPKDARRLQCVAPAPGGANVIGDWPPLERRGGQVRATVCGRCSCEDFGAPHFGRRSRPTPLLTNCRV